MDIYILQKRPKKKEKKKREEINERVTKYIWNEICSCMLKEKGKKSLRRREECKTMPTCVFCFPVDLLECCQERFSHSSRLAPKAHAFTARAGNVGNSDLECFHHNAIAKFFFIFLFKRNLRFIRSTSQKNQQ